jgi:ribonuclease Z
MAKNILGAYSEDIKYRVYGSEPANDTGWRVNSHIIKPGIIYEDRNVKVEAFKVKHGTWPNAFGFRFSTPDKVIVISGDTRPCENILTYGKDADILIHEVYSQKSFERRSQKWKDYHIAHHTSTQELADIANKTKPGLLILYHVLFWGTSEEELLKEVTDQYAGRVVLASDLDIFD